MLFVVLLALPISLLLLGVARARRSPRAHRARKAGPGTPPPARPALPAPGIAAAIIGALVLILLAYSLLRTLSP
ncbi:MAG TPA: hypothetical protein VN874_11045 [Myxococcales bacterium]|jgi:hypothetical protein|nr:hypothetical protein [Myxococcales bacterium]